MIRQPRTKLRTWDSQPRIKDKVTTAVFDSGKKILTARLRLRSNPFLDAWFDIKQSGSGTSDSKHGLVDMEDVAPSDN